MSKGQPWKSAAKSASAGGAAAKSSRASSSSSSGSSSSATSSGSGGKNRTILDIRTVETKAGQKAKIQLAKGVEIFY